MKKVFSFILMFLLVCPVLSVFAEDVPHNDLYDPAALATAFQKLQGESDLYSCYPLTENEVQQSDMVNGVIASYSMESNMTNLNYVTGRLTVYEDKMFAEILGTPPQRTEFHVTCTDKGASGEWLIYSAMFGEVLNSMTGDEGILDWINKCADDCFNAYAQNGTAAKFNEDFSGDGFLVNFSNDPIGGFSFTITITPEA